MKKKANLTQRWFIRVSVFGVMLVLFVIWPSMYPKPLFSYSVERGHLSVHSDMPIPQEQAERFLSEVEQKLRRSPIQTDEMPMQIYIANTQWRRRWLWTILSNSVGGFVSIPITKQHTFLSGADFLTDELISPTGYRTHTPRTLSYFGAHELTHVATAETVSLFRYYQMPEWVREGLADYVAMPPENIDSIYSKIGERDADLAMMQAHGTYAPYRLLVTFFLEEAGWSIEQLLSTDLTLTEARAIVFTDIRGIWILP